MLSILLLLRNVLLPTRLPKTCLLYPRLISTPLHTLSLNIYPLIAYTHASVYCTREPRCWLSRTWSFAGCQRSDRCSPSGPHHTCLLIFLADSRLWQGANKGGGGWLECTDSCLQLQLDTFRQHSLQLADRILVRNPYPITTASHSIHSWHIIDTL